MSANTAQSQSGRFNGIWVKLASDSAMRSPSFFSLASAHRWMRTFWKSPSSSLTLPSDCLDVFARTAVAPTASLCYCAHLYCVAKFDFTDIKFRVILPSAATMALISHHRICLRKNMCLFMLFISGTDEFGYPEMYFCTLTDYNNLHDFIVDLMKNRQAHIRLRCPTPPNINTVLTRRENSPSNPI